MTHFWRFIAVGFGVVFAPAAMAQEPPLEEGCGKARAALRAAEAGALDEGRPGSGGVADAYEDTDVLHYNLELEAVPSSQTLTGTCVITVKSLIDGLTDFGVRLRDNFTITSVTVNGSSSGVSYSRIDTVSILVNLGQTFDTGDEFDLSISYNGVAVSRGFGSIEFTTHNGSDIVYTLSEPWYAYTWWPTKEDDYNNNRDKATGQMSIIVPDSMKVASNGALEGTDALSGGRTRYRWVTGYQTAMYLFCFSATNYNFYEDTYTHSGGTMPFQMYIYPEHDSAANRNAWRNALTGLDVFGQLYGPYPFIDEKYGMCEFEYGGGMEHQTITGQGTFAEYVTLHELSHQWWGDNVTCATWHDIWLNEGFATYSEALWYEFKPGSTGEAALISAMNDRRPSSVNGSVYRYDVSNINSIFSGTYSYRKGGWVLHMLRHAVGSEVFFDMLAAYRAAYEGGAATTAEFQAVCEGVYGSSLTWFFDPWVYQPGAPAYQYAWQQSTTNGVNYVELYLRQVQSGSYPIYTMPIDVRTTISGNNSTQVAWNDAAEEHLLLPVSGTVSALALDPNDYVLNTGKSSVTFIQGPPKIVQMSPAPGATFDADAAPTTVDVWFHKAVNASAGHFSLSGQASGSVPFGFSLGSGDQKATLTLNGPLGPDVYTLTVDDAVTDTASGKSLDGEIADPTAPASLPSGDGTPGGDAIVRFSVVMLHPPGDLNCDGSLNGQDIGAFSLALSDPNAYANQYPDCDRALADMNDDGSVNGQDISGFIDALTHP